MPESMFQQLADNPPVMIWRAGADRPWFNKLGLDFTVPMADFIADLCVDLARSLSADRRGVSIDLAVDAGVMQVERVVIAGMLINELVTNTLKHAFLKWKTRARQGTLFDIADGSRGWVTGVRRSTGVVQIL
jgi:hypothetical protein